MIRILSLFLLLFVTTSTKSLLASSLLPVSASQHVNAVGFVFEGAVVDRTTMLVPDSDRIATEFVVRVNEVHKGILPEYVSLVIPGGTLDGISSDVGLYNLDEFFGNRLWLVKRLPDGTLVPHRGNQSAIPLSASNAALTDDLIAAATAFSGTQEDANDSAVSYSAGDEPAFELRPLQVTSDGLSTTSGSPSRFVNNDGGLPVVYYIDDDALPTSISRTEARQAVENTLNEWAAVSHLEFVFGGYQSLGQRPDTLDPDDRALYLQLHNLHNHPSVGGGTLGVGGSSQIAGFAGDGATVNARQFRRRDNGYVVLDHTSATMENLDTFEEVLCHEIGHALGLSHSSETPGESDPVKAEAVMYFRAHADGRGADPRAWDDAAIALAYPVDDHPPASFGQPFRLVQHSTALSNDVNQVTIITLDRQGDGLSVDSESSSGAFTLNRNGLVISSDGQGLNFFDNPVTGDLGSSFFASTDLTIGDGTHSSPETRVWINAVQEDTQPAGNLDGIPDSWMNEYFGSPTPSAGTLTRDIDDFDGDGMSNLDEYLFDTDPTDPASTLVLGITDQNQITVRVKPNRVYGVRTSDSMSTLSASPISAIFSSGSNDGDITVFFTESVSPTRFYQIESIR